MTSAPQEIARTVDGDVVIFQTINSLRESLYAALASRKWSVNLELPVLVWLDILAEVEDRNPRNYSQFLRDDMMQRLGAAIERLHEEITFVIANGPAPTVAQRMTPSRQKAVRTLISAELKRNLRDKGDML